MEELDPSAISAAPAEPAVVEQQFASPPALDAGGDNGGSNEQPSLFERVRSLGFEAQDEDTLLSHLQSLRDKDGKVAEYERQISEFQTGYIQPKAEFVKQVNDLYDKMAAEGVTAEQFPVKVAEYLAEAGKDYLGMAKNDPRRILEMDYRRKHPNYDDRTLAALVKADMQLDPAPNPEDFDGVDDPEYVAAEDRHLVSKARFNERVEAIARELEASKPKLDFTPKGVKTAEQIATEQAEFERRTNEAWAKSFEPFARDFSGFEFDGIKVPVKMFDKDKDGKQVWAKEFEPVGEVLQNAPEFLSQFYLEDGTPNASTIAKYAAMEKIGMARLFALAKSEAIKELRGKDFPQDGKPITGNPPASNVNAADFYKRLALAQRR